MLDVSIGDPPTHETALKLLLLWRSNLATGQPVAANEPILVPKLVDSSVTPGSSDLAQPLTSVPITAHIQHKPAEIAAVIPSKQGWFPLPAVNPKETNSPISIRFPDSRAILIERGWTDTWFQVCEWLASNGRLTLHDCPIRTSNRTSRYLVHTAPRHSNGRDFGQPRETTTGLFVERQYGPQQILENARFLLDKFGVSPETVELRFE